MSMRTESFVMAMTVPVTISPSLNFPRSLRLSSKRAPNSDSGLPVSWDSVAFIWVANAPFQCDFLRGLRGSLRGRTPEETARDRKGRGNLAGAPTPVKGSFAPFGGAAPVIGFRTHGTPSPLLARLRRRPLRVSSRQARG